MQHIDSIEKLQKLEHQLKSISLVSRTPDYQFNIPELSEQTNHEAGQLMNNHKKECGCFAGGLFMGLSVISVAGYCFISSKRVRDLNLKHFLFFASLVIGSAFLGKIAGLLWVRFRMIQLAQKTLLLAENKSQ